MKIRLKSILAFVLAFAMIFTSSTIQRYASVFASEEKTAVEATTVDETEEEI